jgi:hypothetical protein
MIDQGPQFGGRAAGEAPKGDPAQSGEMSLGFAAAEEKIWIPSEAVVPLLVVDIWISVCFKYDLL